MNLKLSSAPDSFGRLNARYRSVDGAVHNVAVTPPIGQWDGDNILDGFEPDPECYRIYCDGVEVGRLANLDTKRISDLLAI